MLQWNVTLLRLLPKCIMFIHVYVFAYFPENTRHCPKGGLMLADVGPTLN